MNVTKYRAQHFDRKSLLPGKNNDSLNIKNEGDRRWYEKGS